MESPNARTSPSAWACYLLPGIPGVTKLVHGGEIESPRSRESEMYCSTVFLGLGSRSSLGERGKVALQASPDDFMTTTDSAGSGGGSV